MRLFSFFCLAVTSLGFIMLFLLLVTAALSATIALTSPATLTYIKNMTAIATRIFSQKNIFHASTY